MNYMNHDIFTILVGGKAGEGVKKAGMAAAHLFSQMDRQVFQMDDYQSLIKGGHNFSVVSSSRDKINSHYLHADLAISLDHRSFEIHKNDIAKKGVSIYNSDTTPEGSGIGISLTKAAKNFPKPDLLLGVGAVTILAFTLGLTKPELEKLIKKEYPRGIKDNVSYASSIYDLLPQNIFGKFSLESTDESRKILTGNEAISLGAAAGGLDVYIAYPMTPASSILHYLAAHSKELGIAVVHPENEIAVANMAIGASFAGARAMVGSSGGGFALMEEALSLAGMTETPLLCILSSRPGPSTGVPTYTEQADLRFAINQGHGDFSRIVCSPGSIEEAFYLTAEMMELVWRFQIPGILLTEKHLAESSMTVDLTPENASWPEMLLYENAKATDTFGRYEDTTNGISPMLFPPAEALIKWNSYEHDETGITTEDSKTIIQMHDKRQRKHESMISHLKTIDTVNIFDSGEPIIFTYGSTTMSVLESLRYKNLKATVVQPRFLEPLPIWELEKFAGKPSIIVEQSVSGQFTSLLYDKLRIEPITTIKRYDGRPFEPSELAADLEKILLEVS
jgi:2-oxoglutarate ferredoxin oxidoreductase subunit alpha